MDRWNAANLFGDDTQESVIASFKTALRLRKKIDRDFSLGAELSELIDGNSEFDIEKIQKIKDATLEIEDKNRIDLELNRIINVYSKFRKYNPGSEEIECVERVLSRLGEVGYRSTKGQMVIDWMDKWSASKTRYLEGMRKAWRTDVRGRFKEIELQYRVLQNRTRNIQDSRFKSAVRAGLTELLEYAKGTLDMPNMQVINRRINHSLLDYMRRENRKNRVKHVKKHYKRLLSYRKSSNPDLQNIVNEGIRELNAYLKEGQIPDMNPKYETIEAALIKEKSISDFQKNISRLKEALAKKVPIQHIKDVNEQLNYIAANGQTNIFPILVKGISKLMASEAKDYLTIAAYVSKGTYDQGILTAIPALLKSYVAEEREAYLNFLAIMTKKHVNPTECHRKLGVAMTIVEDKRHYFDSLMIYYQRARARDLDNIIRIANCYQDESPKGNLSREAINGQARARVYDLAENEQIPIS